MVESILGAIYFDFGGNLETCWKFLHHLELAAYFERLVANDAELRHPQNILSSEVIEKVRYHITHAEEQGDLRRFAEAGSTWFLLVSGGISRDVITTRAAESALGKLHAGPVLP